MPEINKISSLAIASVAKVNSLAKASIAKILNLAPPTPCTAHSCKSIEFDGSNDYIETGYEFLNQNKTFSVWAKRTSTGHNDYMLSDINSSNNGFLFGTFSTTGFKFMFGFEDGEGNEYWGHQANNIGFTDGTGWHHLVLCISYGEDAEGNPSVNSFQNATVSAYLDGSLVWGGGSEGSPWKTGAAPNNKVGSTTPLTLRIARGDSSNYFPGHLDDIAVWDDVLTDDEVTAIYNSGVPIDLTSNSGDYTSSSDLEFYLKMGDGDTYPTITDHGSKRENGTMTNMTSGDIVTDVPTGG
jgi:hypothetical protein